MCFAASYHYLKTAFQKIEAIKASIKKSKDEDIVNSSSYIDWIEIQGYEIGIFWKIVFSPFLDGIKNDTSNKLLNKFLKV